MCRWKCLASCRVTSCLPPHPPQAENPSLQESPHVIRRLRCILSALPHLFISCSLSASLSASLHSISVSFSLSYTEIRDTVWPLYSQHVYEHEVAFRCFCTCIILYYCLALKLKRLNAALADSQRDSLKLVWVHCSFFSDLLSQRIHIWAKWFCVELQWDKRATTANIRRSRYPVQLFS